MEFVSGLVSEADSFLGNIAKAVLVFPDAPPDNYTEEEVPNREEGLGGAASGVTAAVKGVAESCKKVGNALKEAGSLMGNLTMDKKIAELGGKALRVQFNPATIHINARGGGRAPITNHGNGGNQAATIKYGALDPYIEVQFTLIFDQTNIADAFFEDKFAMSATSLVKNGVTAGYSLLSNKEFSVRPFVEGFLAAIRHENYRNVVFLWGEMRYEGIMNTAQCRYTMFSPSGNPIRAEIAVRILAASAKNPQEGKPATKDYTDYWKKRYKDIIDKNTTTNADGTYIDAGKMSNQFSNMFNL